MAITLNRPAGQVQNFTNVSAAFYQVIPLAVAQQMNLFTGSTDIAGNLLNQDSWGTIDITTAFGQQSFGGVLKQAIDSFYGTNCFSQVFWNATTRLFNFTCYDNFANVTPPAVPFSIVIGSEITGDIYGIGVYVY